jgi:hypothetical protein
MSVVGLRRWRTALLIALAGCGRRSAISAGHDAAALDGPVDQMVFVDAVPPSDRTNAEAEGEGDADRDGADGADADADADGGDAVLSRCGVTTDRPPPYQVRFRLINRNDRTVYLDRRGCQGVRLEVSSCARRYTDSLGPSDLCVCDCSDASCRGPLPCPPCPSLPPLPLGPGESVEVPWMALEVSLRDRGASQCLERTFLPAALYDVRVPVYDDADLALAATHPARTAHRTFALPAPGDVVEVGLPAIATGAVVLPPACEAGATAQVCAPPWDPATACNLDAAFTFVWEPGFGPPHYDQMALELPNTYRRTRMFADPRRPWSTCSNTVPRCDASAAVFTTADVVQAMAAPDVQAALAEPTPLVYGYDSRTYDGSVLIVTRADRHGFIVGEPCNWRTYCQRPLPPGLAWVATILGKLDQQQRWAPGCEALAQ